MTLLLAERLYNKRSILSEPITTSTLTEYVYNKEHRVIHTMKDTSKHFSILGQSFLSCQDYDLIDFEILQFEKRLEEMERLGHKFCAMCCIEVSKEEELCFRCDQGTPL